MSRFAQYSGWCRLRVFVLMAALGAACEDDQVLEITLRNEGPLGWPVFMCTTSEPGCFAAISQEEFDEPSMSQYRLSAGESRKVLLDYGRGAVFATFAVFVDDLVHTIYLHILAECRTNANLDDLKSRKLEAVWDGIRVDCRGWPFG